MESYQNNIFLKTTMYVAVLPVFRTNSNRFYFLVITVCNVFLCSVFKFYCVLCSKRVCLVLPFISLTAIEF